jgi:hypothetical protein
MNIIVFNFKLDSVHGGRGGAGTVDCDNLDIGLD